MDITARGYIEVIERDAVTGVILGYFRGPNHVTDVGVTLMAERIRGNTEVSGVSHYALGDNSTPPVGSDTALLAELYRDLLTQTRTSAGELTMTLHLGSSQGNGMTFREGGAFNLENKMICRVIFPDKAKTSSKELTFIHTIPLTAA